MSYPLRENLEVHTDRGASWIRCTRCFQVISRLEEDWREHCLRKTLPPTAAGPLMGDLAGRYSFRKLYCPSCGVLLDADMEEI